MNALTDLDEMPAGPYRGRIMRNVPAIHLLGLLDTKDEILDKHPAVKGYILNAIRQLRAEAHPPATNGDHD
jgi:hypothetical protein